MSINLKEISSNFQTETLTVQATQAEYRRFQAVFYSNRQQMWESSKGQIFRDALENKLIEPTVPRIKRPDGSFIPAEFDEDDIKDLYSDAWKTFEAEYDRAFGAATIEEIGEYSQAHFGKSVERLVELNAQRAAVKFNR